MCVVDNATRGACTLRSQFAVSLLKIWAYLKYPFDMYTV